MILPLARMGLLWLALAALCLTGPTATAQTSGPSCTSFTYSTNGIPSGGTPPEPTILDVFAVSGPGSTTVFAGHHTAGLGISTDGGLTFSMKNTTSGLGGLNVRGVFALAGPTSTTVYAACYGNGLSISTDGGNTFTNKTTTNGLASNNVQSVYAVAGPTSTTIYAACFGAYLSISTDGGNTFTTRNNSNGLPTTARFVYDVFALGSTVYASTSVGVFISTDGGNTFSQKTTVRTYNVYAVAGPTSTTVYAAADGSNSGPGLTISTDGGNTFTTFRTTANGLYTNRLNQVYVVGQTVYVSTSYGISISTDGGNTFTTYDSSDGLNSNVINSAHVAGGNIYLATWGVGRCAGAVACTPPTVTIAPTSQTITSGQSATLTASGATSYTWSNGSTANPLVLSNVTSATTLSVTGVTGACSATASGSIAIARPTVAILTPAANGTAITTPTISGTATPNAVVTISGGPGSTGGPVSVTAGPTGTYSTSAITFPPGPQSITALAANTAGTSIPAVISFTAVGPPSLTVSEPVNTTSAASPIVSGSATPGSVITITDPTGATLCSTTATSGTFACGPIAGLASGPNTLTVTASGPGGSTSVPVSFTTLPTVAILTPAANGLATLTPTISGTATPNAVVTISGGPGSTGGPVSVTAGPTGAYSTSAITFPAGPQSITALAANAAGTSIPSVISFTAVGPPSLTVLTPAANGTAITTPTISGTATPNAVVTISGGPGSTGGPVSVTAGPTGTYSTSAITFPAGPQSITALATTTAGVSAPSVISFTAVSPTVPPILTVPILSASSVTVCEGGVVSVSATVNGTVTYQWYKDGQSLGSAQQKPVLSLVGVQGAQAGSYVLVIQTSGFASATSTAVTVTVNPLPTVVLIFFNSTLQTTDIIPTIAVQSLTGATYQVQGGVSYERVVVLDQINGYQIRQVLNNTTGIFPIDRLGLYTITVTGANGCKRTVQGVITTAPGR